MPDGAEFYMLPIEAGYYQYPALLDGTLSIEHVAECQDAMAFAAENRARAATAPRGK